MEFKRIAIAGEAIAVAFDMCSSSDMLEELILRNDIRPYDYVISRLKHHLADAQRSVLFDPYKFMGDGWILLFPAKTDGASLWRLLTGLTEFYRVTLAEHLLPRLNTRPTINGLTFGIEMGPIAKMTIFQQREHVGRPIVIACRLQSAIKSIARNPANKALISATVFAEYFGGVAGIRGSNKTVPLRNIRGGRAFHCRLTSTSTNANAR